jgi:hypothetical protein
MEKGHGKGKGKGKGTRKRSRKRKRKRRATVISPDKSAAQGSAFEESSRPGLAGAGAWLEVSGQVRGS